MKPMRIGLIGCGRISDIYIRNIQSWSALDLVACASLDRTESEAKASQHGIPKACLPEDIFADPDIDCVLNLTIPAAHADINRRALETGKHVYCEKPFVTDRADGEALLALAAEKKLLTGCAPDTFLGGRLQTCRQMIDDGLIGKPLGATVFVGTHGVERHHPNPDFYYQPGGGPLLDLGPYYLTALVALLGPIVEVSGMARRSFPTRTIENGLRDGETIPVDVDTHALSLFAFASGALGSMTMSFDIWDSETPRLEIYGEAGTICLPDPDPVHGANAFGGPLWYRTRQTSRWAHQPRRPSPQTWQEAPIEHGFTENSRGLGLLDLAYAAHEKRPARASGELAFHVFDVMDAMARSAQSRQHEAVHSRCQPPSGLPVLFPTHSRSQAA
jgi:predicted dehydrogenase